MATVSIQNGGMEVMHWGKMSKPMLAYHNKFQISFGKSCLFLNVTSISNTNGKSISLKENT